MANNKGIQEQHYKEVSPKNTVRKVRDILCDLDITTVDFWTNDGENGCYALRTTIAGTNMGTNGKGVGENYALASSYAEFMERLQNNMLYMGFDEIDAGNGFTNYVDEKTMSTEELINQNDSVLNFIFNQLEIEEESQEEKIETVDRLYDMNKIAGKQDGRVCIPFYSMEKNKIQYMALDIFLWLYGSNGMCAGNSPEEAISQGLSEILERYIQRKIMNEFTELPDVPEEYMMKFPKTYGIFKELEKIEGYKFLMKDCSFGGKYPVAAFVCIEQNTGKFGLKFGAHPDFGLAMERTMTEAFQGKSLANFARNSKITFDKSKIKDRRNIYNTFKFAVGSFPTTLLTKSNKEFTPVADVSKFSNKEILNKMLTDIRNDGFDVLVRNVSYLGFDSYFVIVPGMSEITEVNIQDIKAISNAVIAAGHIRKPSKITKEKCEQIRDSIEHYATSQIENTIQFLYGMPLSYNFVGEEAGLGNSYLAAMCCIGMEDYKSAFAKLSIVQGMYRYYGMGVPLMIRLITDYCNSRYREYEHEEAVRILKNFYNEKLISEFEELFETPTALFEKQYPELVCPNCSECQITSQCDLFEYRKIVGNLQKKQMESFPDQNGLGKILKI